MKLNQVKNYFINCFLLTVPILVWDIAFENKLPKAFQPEIFWNNIYSWVTYGENISRTLVFAIILLMPLNISTPRQKKGLILYSLGTCLYFASWLLMIYLPSSSWSQSMLGFMAPSYTPLFWLVGIGLIGDSFYFNLPFNRWFVILASIIFLTFHNIHTYTIYLRTN
jgi:hypothetical protein